MFDSFVPIFETEGLNFRYTEEKIEELYEILEFLEADLTSDADIAQEFMEHFKEKNTREYLESQYGTDPCNL